PVARPPRADGRAYDRGQAGHGRQRRCRVPALHAAEARLPRPVAGARAARPGAGTVLINEADMRTASCGILAPVGVLRMVGGGGGVDHAGGRGPRPGPRRGPAALGCALRRASELIGWPSAVGFSAVAASWPGDVSAALSKAVPCLSANSNRRIVRRSLRSRWLVARCCLSCDSL